MTPETINQKITDAFQKLPTVEDQRNVIDALIEQKEARIELENKELQDKINNNNKLKEGK